MLDYFNFPDAYLKNNLGDLKPILRSILYLFSFIINFFIMHITFKRFFNGKTRWWGNFYSRVKRSRYFSFHGRR
jgi:hypothetical protein